MTRYFAVAIAVALAGPALAWGQPDRAKKIAPVLDGQTLAVAHVDLEKVDAGRLVKLMTDIAKLGAGEAAMMEVPLKLAHAGLVTAGAREMFVVLTLDGLPQDSCFAAIPFDKEEDGQKIAKAVKVFVGTMDVRLIKNLVVIGQKSVIQRLVELQPAAPVQLGKAFAAAGQADARLAIVLPEPLRKSLGEVIPELPKQLGGAKTVPLLKGFQYLSIGATLAPKVSVEASLKATDAKASEQIRAALIAAMTPKAKGAPEELKPVLDKAIKLLTPKHDKDQLTWKLTEDEVIPIAQPLVAKMRNVADLSQSTNNLKQIGLAMHAFHDVNNQLPANIRDKNNKPLLSWRVQLLPYIEQDNLYKQFKLDEPWDSAHNKELIGKMSPLFRTAGSKAKPGHTTYLAPSGKGLFIDGAKAIKITEMADGTSNTIVVLEVDDSHAAIWTKPDDLIIDPQQPLKGLSGGEKGRFSALFGDGSVRSINAKKLDGQVLYKYLTIAGGEVVPDLP